MGHPVTIGERGAAATVSLQFTVPQIEAIKLWSPWEIIPMKHFYRDSSDCRLNDLLFRDGSKFMTMGKTFCLYGGLDFRW